MKKNDRKTQIILLLAGVLLFVITYIYYPSINKKQSTHQQTDRENIENKDETTLFTNIEYKGLYNIDIPFKIESEKAYILNDEPDLVYMDKMHIILYLTDGREVNIVSDKGTYNKLTYDCFLQQNVKATDGTTVIFAENLDLLAAKNSAEIYNEVNLNYTAGNLQADKIYYNFDTKNFKVSMFDDSRIKMKVIR